jgi:hypothetical protein|tara:strand:- start:868 stop:1038 length:171 start_codon:yes stop_codon:yes gene_type:complete
MKRGARPRRRDENSRTALNMTMRNGHIGTADALVEKIALQQAVRADLRSIRKNYRT